MKQMLYLSAHEYVPAVSFPSKAHRFFGTSAVRHYFLSVFLSVFVRGSTLSSNFLLGSSALMLCDVMAFLQRLARVRPWGYPGPNIHKRFIATVEVVDAGFQHKNTETYRAELLDEKE